MPKAANPVSPQRPVEFGRWVRQGLRQLFDSPSLGMHPLADLMLDPADTLDRSQSLRQVLLDAVESLRPDPGVPRHSYAWRAFRILELRFLEGLSPEEAMDQLALQKSQFYRDQARALDAITRHLWEVHQQTARSAAAPDNALDVTRPDTIESEARRLLQEVGEEQVDVNGLLCELGPVLESLTGGRGARLTLALRAPVAAASVSRVLMRQAVLGAAAWALEQGDGDMEVRTVGDGQTQEIHISVGRSDSLTHGGAVSGRAGQGPPISQQVMSIIGGSSHTFTGAGYREVRMVWPLGQAPVVLVIDDNRGFADLVCRYLSGHGWHVIGAPSGSAARESIARARPRVILLDVMMPHEDGWELLMALKSDPHATDIPVIICSVLAQPALATALGADAYLQKPISEESLLRALAPWPLPSASLASSPPGRPPGTAAPR